jgi:hypothetical protein
MLLVSSAGYSQGSKLANASTVNITKTIVSDSASKNSLVADTAAYIKSMVNNKDKYIGKPLGLLLDDLKIPPKSYFIEYSRQNVKIVPSIEIFFDDEKTTSRKIENIDGLDNPVILQIIWQPPVLSSNAREVRQKNSSNGNWQAPEQEFYSKQIVCDIKYYYNSRK